MKIGEVKPGVTYIFFLANAEYFLQVAHCCLIPFIFNTAMIILNLFVGGV